MPQLNPNSPETVGVEWFPIAEPGRQLAGPHTVMAAVLDSASTEQINNLYLFLSSVSGAGEWEVEVYELDAMTRQTLATDTYDPTADGTVNIGAVDELGSTADLWDSIDEPLSVNTYVTDQLGVGFDFTVRHGGGAGNYNGRRITNVRVATWVSPFSDTDPKPSSTVQHYLRINGHRYFGAPRAYADSVFDIFEPLRPEDMFITDWPINPATGMSWKYWEVDGFDPAASNVMAGDGLAGTTTLIEVGLTASAVGSVNSSTRAIYQEIAVTSEPNEPRVAFGKLAPGDFTNFLVPGAPLVGWNLVALRDLTNVPGWAKANGTTYLILARRTSGEGAVTVRRLDGPMPPTPTWSNLDGILIDAAGRPVEGSGPANTVNPDDVYGALLEDTATVDWSVDSQPYVSISDDDDFPTVADVVRFTRVNSQQTLRSDFTAPTSDSYGVVRVIVAKDANVDIADLTVRIRRRADDMQIGGVGVISSDELDYPATAFRAVDVVLASDAALVNGIDYYFEFSSSAERGEGWRVQGISAYADAGLNFPTSSGGALAATFGGATRGLRIGATLHAGITSLAVAQTQPAAPSGFTATALGEAGCLEAIRLAWNATALGADFGQYELQRRDGFTDDDWQTIAVITDEGVEAFDDWEARRNTAADYRMRVRRADDAPSDWTATQSATASMGCDGWLAFTSNEEPSVNGAWCYSNPTRFTLVDEPVERRFFGRDYGVVFRPIEEGGDEIAVELLIAGAPQRLPATPGRAAFDAVEALGDASLSYVCVGDTDGNRWFAAVIVSELRAAVRSEPGGRYTLEVRIREVTDTPSTPDATT